MNINKIKKNLGADWVFIISVILTIPPLIIWVLGILSYLWFFIDKYISQGLGYGGQIALLLIFPFVTANISLINYLKTKNKSFKRLLIINFVLILLFFISSLIFGD